MQSSNSLLGTKKELFLPLTVSAFSAVLVIDLMRHVGRLKAKLNIYIPSVTKIYYCLNMKSRCQNYPRLVFFPKKINSKLKHKDLHLVSRFYF